MRQLRPIAIVFLMARCLIWEDVLPPEPVSIDPGEVIELPPCSDTTATAGSPQVTLRESDVTLEWQGTLAEGFQWYVERDPGNGSFATLAIVETASYADATIDLDATYVYRVRSGNGGCASDPSAAITVITKPRAPTAMSATMTTADDFVHLTWTDASTSETGYRIERDLMTIATLPAGTTSYDDASAALDTTYTYRAIALRDALASAAASDTVVTRPAPPTVTAQTVSTSAVRLTWPDESTTAVGYRVLEGTAVLAEANTLQYQRNGLAENDARTYRVVALGPEYESAPREVVARSSFSPQVMLSMSPMLAADCRLSVPGSVTFDTAIGAGLASATGMITGVSGAVAASGGGISGVIDDKTPGTFAASWTVTDTLGGAATAPRALRLDYTPQTFRTAPVLPSLASFEDPSSGRQPWFTPEPLPAGACADCSGRRSAMTSGAYHTCVVVDDGHVNCWGDDFRAQLGDGTLGDANNIRTAAVQTLSITDARALAATDKSTCALLETGALKCWGNGAEGQLGDGVFVTQTTTPIDVCASGTGGSCVPLTGVIAVGAGFRHVCAVLASGVVQCFGLNDQGQLGNGVSGTFSANPVTTPVNNAVAVALGSTASCALTDAGSVTCWGGADRGQVGDGTTGDGSFRRLTPVGVSCGSGDGCADPADPLTNIVAIASGSNFACALRSNGRVKCWGAGSSNRLGNGLTSDQLRPVDVCVSGSGACTTFVESAIAISAGNDHACALIADGTMRCWGTNAFGQLGNGDNTFNFSADPVCATGTGCVGAAIFGGVTAISLGDDFSCATREDGSVRCWGRYQFGQLGDGTKGTSLAFKPNPQPVCFGSGCGVFANAARRSCGVLSVVAP